MHNAQPISMQWGARSAEERGPVVTLDEEPEQGNAFGAHGDLYSFQIGMARVLGYIESSHTPNLDHTEPAVRVGPFPIWSRKDRIVTVDPWGHVVGEKHEAWRRNGVKMMPSAAVNRSYFHFPEIAEAVRQGRLKADGERPTSKDVPDTVILDRDGVFLVTEITGEQVWYLPGIAKLLGTPEQVLRQRMFEEFRGNYRELIERDDLKVMLPQIGNHTILIFGDPRNIGRTDIPIVMRPHDSCDDGDLGALRCTCRAYLMYAIEECIKMGQSGGLGYIFRYVAQGRGFGSVAKHLVYQKREQQPGGDRACRYFDCTKEIMGGKDGRLDWSKVGPMLWVNIHRIHTLLSMSPHKIGPMVDMGIHIDQAHPLPKERVPLRALTEITAKIGGGYFDNGTYDVETILNGER